VAESDRPDPAERMQAGYARAEEKNRRVRESLEPLGAGERPTVITVGAIFCAVMAAIAWSSAGVALLTGAEVDGVRPNVAQLALTGLITTGLAWGLWKARYWAALAFQALLLLLLIAGVAGLVLAGTLAQALTTFLLVVLLGAMFWFMVKAMARIQMPESAPGEQPEE
jgi:hypothetical protein